MSSFHHSANSTLHFNIVLGVNYLAVKYAVQIMEFATHLKVYP